MATGPQLNAVAGVLLCASRLQRTIQQAARAAGSDTALVAAVHPITAAFEQLQLPRRVVDEVQRCVEEEDGRVRDTASEEVRRTRARVTTLANRVRGILRGYPGEVTEVNGRLALAVAKADAGSIAKVVWCYWRGVVYHVYMSAHKTCLHQTNTPMRTNTPPPMLPTGGVVGFLCRGCHCVCGTRVCGARQQ